MQAVTPKIPAGTPGKTRRVKRRGRTWRVYDSHPHWPDGVDFWSAFEDGSWRPGLEDQLGPHLGPDRTLVDIGAWVGPVSLIAAGMCRHVYAVEPDAAAADRLRVNLMMAEVDNVTVFEAAAWNRTGYVELRRRATGRWGDSTSSVIHDPKVGEAAQVPCWSVKDLFARLNLADVGLIKIDVEGGEAEILADATPFLREVGAPLLLSVHQPMRTDRHNYEQTLEAALDGWTLTVLDGSMTTLGLVLAERKPGPR